MMVIFLASASIILKVYTRKSCVMIQKQQSEYEREKRNPVSRFLHLFCTTLRLGLRGC